MPQSRLKIFRGPEEVDFPVTPATNDVTVPVGEVLPLLADAVDNQRTWLKDFADEDITISADLYEVLQAYRFFRRPSA